MDFDPLYLLRRKRRGVQCERALRSIYILLSRWNRYSGDRLVLQGSSKLEKQQQPATKMTAIPFDKLIMLFGRVWDELFDRTGAVLKARDPKTISDSEANLVISFPLPFEELPGKHGPGRAVRRKDGEPQFLVSVIHALGEDEIMSYFDVQLPSGSDNANDPRTTVEPALAATADVILLEDFTKKEREVLDDLANGVRRLGLEEIRALGTHENFQKTADDVEREFRYMRRHLDEIDDCLSGAASFETPALEVFECADEACRKSRSNRKHYEFARDGLVSQFTNVELKEAFLDCHEPAASIWDNPEMRDLARRSSIARVRADYLKEIGRWSAKPRSRGQKDLSDLCNELRKNGDVNLPSKAQDIFADRTGAVHVEHRQKILDLTRLLRRS